MCENRSGSVEDL